MYIHVCLLQAIYTNIILVLQVLKKSNHLIIYFFAVTPTTFSAIGRLETAHEAK